jgi:CRP-like cAMP-binding protein
MPPHRPSAGRTSPFFDGLEPQALQAVLAAGRARRFTAGHVLCRAGEPAELMFVITKGQVRLSRVAPSGREVVIAVLVEGDAFGIGSLLIDSVDYIGTGVALGATEAHVWTREAILRAAKTYPQLSRNALGIALRYVATLTERHIGLIAGTAEQRLARTLTKLGSRSGTHTPSGIEIAIKNEHLASLADVSPYTASRLLNAWERDGAVHKSRGKVSIACPEKLLFD